MSGASEQASPAAAGEASTPVAPFLHVVSGDPSPEELAALIAVIAARSGTADDASGASAPSAWTDRSRGLRTPLHHGPGAWRASAFPR